MDDSRSRRTVLKYALVAPLSLAAASTAAPKASAQNLSLVDFTHRQPAPEQIKAAGFDGALV